MTITKKILALIACLALVLSSVGLCFADVSLTIPTMTVGVCEPVFSQSLNNGDLVIFQYDRTSLPSNTVTLLFNNVYCKATYSGNNSTFFLSTDSSFSSSYVYYYAEYKGSYWEVYLKFEGTSNGSELRLWSVTNNSFNSYYRIGNYYLERGLIFPSIGSGDAISWNDNSVVGEVVQFTLEPGYAYVIEGACEVSDRTFSLTGTSNLSALSNKNGSVQWFGSVGNIRDGFSPDLNNSENLVFWSPLNSNPSGEASNYSYHATDVINVSSGAAYVITYPLYYGSKYVPTGASAVIQNSVNMSGSVYIEYTGDRPTMRRVALKSEQSYADNFISYYNTFQPSVLNETVTYTVSDDVVTVDPSTAPAGGADAGTPSENVDNTILGVLQRFINNISGLISSGSHAIQELVTLGSSFMMSIAAMFQWLPSGLTTLIITAFTIVLVIGVIKLLWK